MTMDKIRRFLNLVLKEILHGRHVMHMSANLVLSIWSLLRRFLMGLATRRPPSSSISAESDSGVPQPAFSSSAPPSACGIVPNPEQAIPYNRPNHARFNSIAGPDVPILSEPTEYESDTGAILSEHPLVSVSRAAERFGGESNNDTPESSRNTSPTLTEVPSHTTEVDPGIRNEQCYVTPNQGLNAIQPAGNVASPAHEIALRPLGYTPQVETTRPSKIQRYDRNVVIPKTEEGWDIKTLTLAPGFDTPSPSGWQACVHPEGQRYHRSRIEGIHYITESNVCNEDEFENIRKFSAEIQTRIQRKRNNSEFPVNHELEVVLELGRNEMKTPVWQYYIVDNTDRHIFWLEGHCADDLAEQVGGIGEIGHLRHILDHEYYLHLSYFPHGKTLPENFFRDMKGLLMWGITDSMTSMDSLTPYSVAEVRQFLDLLKDMESSKFDDGNQYVVASAARLKSIYAHECFYNFSGHHGARISREQTVHGDKTDPPSRFHQLLFLLLFRVPKKRLHQLDEIYIDNKVQRLSWKSFSEKLVNSWQQEVINAAVLLNANIAYLAIPGVTGNGGNAPGSPGGGGNTTSSQPSSSGSITAGQLASLISVVCTVSSVILGLLLAKRLRRYDDEQIEMVADYLYKWSSPKRGLIKLALMFSLPYAGLMWGAVMFAVAIGYLPFSWSHVNMSIFQYTILFVVFTCSALLCIWTIFEISDFDSFKEGIKFWQWPLIASQAPDAEEEEDVNKGPSHPRLKCFPCARPRVRRQSSEVRRNA